MKVYSTRAQASEASLGHEVEEGVEEEEGLLGDIINAGGGKLYVCVPEGAYISGMKGMAGWEGQLSFTGTVL